MNQEEKEDHAWDLLKHAKPVEPTAFFVRNVLREVRGIETSPAGVRGWFYRARSLFAQRGLLAGATACAALALILVPLLNRGVSLDETTSTLTLSDNQSAAFDPASEMAAIEYLGQLMAVADPGQLDDASLAELFF